MDPRSVARATLAMLYAERHGRPVPLAELERRLGEDVLEDLEALREHRLVRRVEDGWVPTSPPLASRAPVEAARATWLYA